ncbi:MAG: FAD:protein FMN transferase [Gemmatimonadota bacterium]|nr:FAD:protein FMN transferase [Gemmatimonadota bacterium]
MHRTQDIARKLAALQHLGFERVADPGVATESTRVGRGSHMVTARRPSMGTLVSVSTLAPSPARAEEAIGRAFEEMDRLVAIFSRYEHDSAISALNEHGRLDGSPPELAGVVERSLVYHTLSRGAFDVSIAPVLDLFVASPGGTPTAGEMRDALEVVGASGVAVDGRRVNFARPGMRITLDGIAKGFIVDAIADVLRRHKVHDHLINAGGDIRTSGRKQGRRPWTVAVQHPAKDGSYPDTIHLSDGAVATSGMYEHYFDRDQLIHHIVDGTTGQSPDECASVSVTAPTAMAADALSTTVFVLGPTAGIPFVEGLPGCECLIIDRVGRQRRSRGWKSAGAVTGGEEGEV